MVPAARILEKAIEIDADLIGLSGLITPSLDEMTHVASEMERQGFTIPLLIGGATTSRTHTAVKIAPAYSGPVVHVLDASRAVGVAGVARSSRIGATRSWPGSPTSTRSIRRRTGGPARQGTAPDDRPRRAPTACRSTGPTITPPRPTFLGPRTFADYPLDELVPYIDWTPFFATWELRGLLPGDPRRPSAGRGGSRPAPRRRRLLERIVAREAADARTPSSASGRRTPSAATTSRSGATSRAREALATFRTLRQQMAKPDGRPNVALADFVAPAETGVADYVGGFAVTTGHGLDELVAKFEAANDDYSAILAKALADRLAEAFAERLHERVRRELWGYAPDEALSNTDLIAERYQGIRPAPGYPACPDHTEKATLFDLLEAEGRAGIDADGVVRDVAGRVCLGLLPLEPGEPLLRGRPDRARPARRLRRPEGRPGRRGRALAGPEPGRRHCGRRVGGARRGTGS